MPEDVVPGQDLGVSLQALLGWMSHYGHLSYACTARMAGEKLAE
ncbi:hypothetical protein N44_04764 [Microcystis aeruginosa NIES-44]|uniref:Uncharacterized protein n=1 Tax=Microcystis aeruginosa NIES-44 TaxID=449439 RepID=A0A0A1W2G3_MICAE|nr:hypothetical protein N44_04764 [Microcystis aeruginosa NIES-44]